MRVVFRILGAGVLAVVVVVVGLVATAPIRPWQPPEADLRLPEVDVAAVADRLGALIRIDTRNPPGSSGWPEVSTEEGPLPLWQAWVRGTYVTPFGLEARPAGDGLLLTVPGTGAGSMLWLSHVDTVPVEADAVETWAHGPWSGAVADGFVWGRGAIDNKASIVAQLEALAWARDQGIQPTRTLHLLITPDEETTGATARAVAEDHAALGDDLMVLDEGSYVLPDLLPGSLVAGVAVGEKTYVTVTLVAHGEGGHSSMPTGDGAVQVLTRALHRIDGWEADAAVPAPLIETLRRVAPERGLVERVALGHADLLAPLLLPIVQATAAGDAVTRDTIVATMIDGGVKDNVVPARATAVLNARLRPGTDPDRFGQQLAAVIDDDRVDVQLDVAVSGAASAWDTPMFAAIEAVVPQVVPGAVVGPVHTTASMDARYFAAQGLPTYRFHPFVLDAAERARIHGADERIALEDLARGVRFYAGLLQVL